MQINFDFDFDRQGLSFISLNRLKTTGPELTNLMKTLNNELFALHCPKRAKSFIALLVITQ